MTDTYTDYERFQIAKKEYDNELAVGKPVEIGDNDNAKTIGTVREVITDKTGLKAYVVESPDKKEVSVLYQGSVAPPGEGSKADWLDNDLPMAKNILTSEKKATPQLRSAATALNHVLDKYPKAKVTVYGHSLGSMNAQYALANVKDTNRIAGAYLYQGPNVYPVLTEKQRATANMMRYRIHNYVDPMDLIPIGYPRSNLAPNSKNTVGIVHYVASKWNLNPFDQHMWGGYQWNKDGSLKLRKASSVDELLQEELNALQVIKMQMSLDAQGQYSETNISRTEEIFLDSEQALAASEQLISVVDERIQSIQRLADEVIAFCEANWKEKLALAIRLCPDLSRWEVLEAMEAVGATEKKLVQLPRERYERKKQLARSIQDSFYNLVRNIKAGVQQQIETDEELAATFKQWKQT